MRDYYVYTHSVNDKVFYVGKGRGNRAYQIRSRNKYWWEVVNESKDYQTDIVYTDLDEDLAYQLEAKLIKQYGLDNLTNMIPFGPIYEGYDKNGENNPMWGKSHSPESIERIKKGIIGKRYKGVPRPKEVKNKISNTLMGREFSDEHKSALSEAQKNITEVICPHCGKVGTHNMKRYHFDNCKVVNPNNPNRTHKSKVGILLVIDTHGNETKYNSVSEASKIMCTDEHILMKHAKNGTQYKRGVYKNYKFKLI
jgi:hypothetical protein